MLKDMIVRGDGRVAAAAIVYDEDGDYAELLDTLHRYVCPTSVVCALVVGRVCAVAECAPSHDYNGLQSC